MIISMHLSKLSFAITLLTGHTWGANCGPNAQFDLKSIGLSSGTKIFTSTDSNFVNETTQRYTVFNSPTYLQSVKPALESDVQKIVKYAVQHNIPFLATGGGHGFATSFGKLQNGLEIDMSSLNSISINKAASTVTVTGAVLNGDIIEPLFQAGKQLPTGSEKCVGLIGSTLGGGVGRLNGLHGMILDSLLSVRIVTASGDIVTASTTQNSDLFWGIRGAGFNFGIITSATYRVYDLPNNGQIMNADFLYPLNESTAIFNYFKSLESTLPAELALIMSTGFNPSLGGQYLVVNAAYYGPQSVGIPLVQPLIDANPIMQNITTVPYNQLLSAAFFGTAPASAPCVKQNKRVVYGLGISTYDVPTFENYFNNLSSIFNSQPQFRDSVFFIEAFPMQAARKVADNATSYPHRDFNAHLLFNYGYTDASQVSVIDSFGKNARNVFAAKSGFGEIRSYVSYGHGDENPSALYGAQNVARLKSLKSTWDYQGVFNFNEPLS
ncbi:hypothetical protein GGI35DRAFT_474009 [Trichoderma velutinum]